MRGRERRRILRMVVQEPVPRRLLLPERWRAGTCARRTTHRLSGVESIGSRPGGGIGRPGRARLYRAALERGYLDAMLSTFIAAPFVRTFRWCDAMERRWTDFLSGEGSRESDQVKPHFGTIEEFT